MNIRDFPPHDVAESFVLSLSTATKESTETENGLVGPFEFCFIHRERNAFYSGFRSFSITYLASFSGEDHAVITIKRRAVTKKDHA